MQKFFQHWRLLGRWCYFFSRPVWVRRFWVIGASAIATLSLLTTHPTTTAITPFSSSPPSTQIFHPHTKTFHRNVSTSAPPPPSNPQSPSAEASTMSSAESRSDQSPIPDPLRLSAQVEARPPIPDPLRLSAQVEARPPTPDPRPHPLPPSLAAWQDDKQAGSYFDQLETLKIGVLVWTQFPITVYIQPPTEAENAAPFTAKRAQNWIKAVEIGVQDWQPYLPMKLVEQAKEADIAVLRATPPLRVERGGDRDSSNPNSESHPKSPLPTLRARSAETRFELYVRKVIVPGSNPKSLLAHRMTVYIRPDQPTSYTQATARHELGHALGIWGHSPDPTDTMYFSQVRNPAKVSARDLNTLKQIYQQPTRLGWPLP